MIALTETTREVLVSTIVLAGALPLFAWPQFVDRIVAVYVLGLVFVGIAVGA